MILDKETYLASSVAVTDAAVLGGTVVDLVKPNYTVRPHGKIPVIIPVAFAPVSDIASVAVDTAGSGYSVDDVLTIAGGTGATVKVKTVDTGGEVLTVELLTGGSGYSAANAAATTGGGGTGCKLDTTLSGTAGTAVTFELVAADNDALTTNPVVLASSGSIALAALVKDAMVHTFDYPSNLPKRYFGIKATPTGEFAAGKFSAFVTMDAPHSYDVG